MLAAGDAQTALDLLERHPAVALVPSDMQRPGPLGGRAMLDTIRERGYRMPAILASASVRPVGSLPATTFFLPKPCSRCQLIQTIARNPLST